METLLNSSSMFNKLDEEGAVFRQDLEDLQVDLGRLMEKHGMAGEVVDEVFDEICELKKPDDGTLPQGWKTKQPVKKERC